MAATSEVLAFDWGTNIIGILDVLKNEYIPYINTEEMTNGAQRIVSSTGTIVSFNGNTKDLMEISKILGYSSEEELHLDCEHNDMLEITSDIRWPPKPGGGTIFGPGLRETYKHYFPDKEIALPSYLRSNEESANFEYILSNWRDCYMTAELWIKWKSGELTP